jgi:hypothetical protein
MASRMMPRMTSRKSPNHMIWSPQNNRYLLESTVDGVLYIDDRRWCQWVTDANDMPIDEYDKFSEEYESVIAKFRDHMYLVADRLMQTHSDYSDWVTWHVSDYLFNGKNTTDSRETSAMKQQKFLDRLQKYRKELLFCTDGYIYTTDYDDICMLYGKSLILDMDLKGDHLDKMWEFIWRLMEDNKDEINPQRIVRKNEDVIEMRKSLRKHWDDYVRVDAEMVKKIITYYSEHSIYLH